MGISLTASLFLALGLMHPIISLSAFSEDLEGSGYDSDSNGSGSGDWLEQGEMIDIKDHSNSKEVRIFAANEGGGTKNTFHGLGNDGGSGFVVANSKSFLERKEVFDGVIAGGVTGVVLAAALAAILIYKWQKKDDGGYILGQQRASDEDYHTPNREEVVV